MLRGSPHVVFLAVFPSLFHLKEVAAMLLVRCSTIDSDWPEEEPGCPDPEELDDDSPLELDDESWDALIPDDDYEPLPEYGDFWTNERP
jgi:hypothetical protein